MSLCTLCKLKVFSHFTCPGLCYSLSAKTVVFTAQARVTMISPSEESGGCLPWGHWGGNWVFRASVTFFWICLPLTQSMNMAGTSTKSSITSLPCLSKPSVGISPAVPKATEMHMVQHSAWAHKVRRSWHPTWPVISLVSRVVRSHWAAVKFRLCFL